MERDPAALPGMRRNPWALKLPNGTAYKAFRDVSLEPPSVVVQAGGAELRYNLRCLEDLHEMLKARGGWVLLGACGDREAPPPGSVEAWARSPANPVRGWYGLARGRRGEFAAYIPPIMVVLNLAEVEDSPQGRRMRAT